MAANSLGNIFVRLGLRTKGFDTGWKNAENRTKRGTSGILGNFKKLRTGLLGVGAALTVAFGAFGAINEARAFETGITSVVKTTGLAGAELKKFEAGIESLERTIPKGARELLNLSSVAGQMGVTGSANLLKFTKTLAQLESASDIVGEDGAKSLARLLNITGEGVGVIDRLGAALVAMGNSAAASEGEIVHMATFVGQAIGQFGARAADIVGLSTAMKELGLRAESSGSATGRAFVKINTAIQTGGDKALQIANLLGFSVEELQKRFKEDSVAVFVRFLEALKAQGDKATITLKGLGLAGDENLKVFPILAQNVDLVRQRLEQASKEWQSNTALTNEAAAAADTFDSQIKILFNNFRIFVRGIGQAVLPALKEFVKALNEAFNSGPETRLKRLVEVGEAVFKDLVTIGEAAFKDLSSNIEVAMGNAFEAIRPRWDALLKYFQETLLVKLDEMARSTGSFLGKLNPFSADTEFLEQLRRAQGLADGEAKKAGRSYAEIFNDEIAKNPPSFALFPGPENLAEVQAKGLASNVEATLNRFREGTRQALEEAEKSVSVNPAAQLFPGSVNPAAQLVPPGGVNPSTIEALGGRFDKLMGELQDGFQDTLPTVKATKAAVGGVGDELETVTAKVIGFDDRLEIVQARALKLPDTFARVFNPDQVRELNLQLDELRDKLQFEALKESIEVVVDGMSSAFRDFVHNGELDFKRLARSILADLALIQVKAFTVGTLLKLSDNTTGTTSQVLGLFAKAISGARAHGGPVAGGSSYLVGERGPELFTPGTSGNIVPNHRLGGTMGGPTVVQNIDLRPGVSHAELAKILPLLKEATINDMSKRVANGGRPSPF